MERKSRFIPWAKPIFYGNEVSYVSDAIKSTWISDGKYISKFEDDFSKRLNLANVLTVSNGTTALHLAYLLLGIGAGDEVIVPGFGFIAPVNMAIAVGAKPVYADVDENSWCIDPNSIEQRITPKSKAIVPVHTYGNICDMDAIMDIAKRHDLYVIEDTAEALFSKYNGRFAGSFGDVGCFSFQATKAVAMGEGGAVTIQNPDLVKKANQLKSHGMKEGTRYWHEIVAYNFRLTNIQAALGCAQLEAADRIIKNKKRVFNLYKKELDNTSGFSLQKFDAKVDPVVWAIAVKIDFDVIKTDRYKVTEALKEKGIETRPGFYDCATLPLYGAKNIPVSTKVSNAIISLPSSPDLMDDEIIYICNEFKNSLVY